jgi:DNA-binding transcriptional ArsR family regulator
MTTAFEVLAEPTRRQVLDVLLSGPRPVGQLSSLLGQSQPGMSRHLRILRQAGLVSVRRVAQQRWYEIQPGPLAEIDAWLAPFRKEWSDRLSRLEDHLRESEEAHIA